MISEFLWNVALGKQAEFIINVDFLIKIKKVNISVRCIFMYYLSHHFQIISLIYCASINNYALLCASTPISFFLFLLGYLPRILSSNHLRFAERTGSRSFVLRSLSYARCCATTSPYYEKAIFMVD